MDRRVFLVEPGAIGLLSVLGFAIGLNLSPALVIFDYYKKFSLLGPMF